MNQGSAKPAVRARQVAPPVHGFRHCRRPRRLDGNVYTSGRVFHRHAPAGPGVPSSRRRAGGSCGSTVPMPGTAAPGPDARVLRFNDGLGVREAVRVARGAVTMLPIHGWRSGRRPGSGGAGSGRAGSVPDLPGTGLFHDDKRRLRLGNRHHLCVARSFSTTLFSANLAPHRISSRVGIRCDSSALRSLDRRINVLISCFMVIPP